MNARRFLIRGLGLVVLLGLIFSLGASVNAAQKSPFVGNWVATDVDSSDMTLSIGGPVDGPFKIIWTDDYINFCDGSAGILRGIAFLNTEDAYKLEADLHLQCFTTGAELNFHVTLTYHALTNTLSIFYIFGDMTIWHRPGPPQAPPPGLDLRVNYGDDWVESFYEGGHTAWVVVKDADGNLKGSAEVMTESKDFWGGETGFQTTWGGWRDVDGNPMGNPPDIQPLDWVYGWIDNGASAAVQIGEIIGAVDLAADTISGTILAPWLEDQVVVECLDWGSGNDPPLYNINFGVLSPNGEAEYSCSWGEDWDILEGQKIGVGYFESDDDWVANYFYGPYTSQLAITGFDLDAHVMYGIGNPESTIWIADVDQWISVDKDGKWSAEVGSLEPGSWWTIIHFFPDGNDYRINFRAPFPRMYANYLWNEVVGEEWTPGAWVTLTIDDPATEGIDHTYTQMAEAGGTPYYGYVTFVPVTLQPGFIYTMSDSGYSKTLVLSPLAVIDFNFDDKIIFGTGVPGTQLYVYIWPLDSEWTTVGGDGEWSVFHPILAPGKWGDAIQFDIDGDQTRAGFEAKLKE